MNYGQDIQYTQNNDDQYDNDYYYRNDNGYPDDDYYHDHAPSPDPTLVYPTYTTQQSYSHSGLTVRTVPTQNIPPSQAPQPADAYRTSAPAPTRPTHPPVYGTTIAVSKVHYQPATPMTCEPVTKKKNPSKAGRRGPPPYRVPGDNRSHLLDDDSDSVDSSCRDDSSSYSSDHEQPNKVRTTKTRTGTLGMMKRPFR